MNFKNIRKCKTDNCETDISERHILTKYCHECSIQRNKMTITTRIKNDKKNK